MKGGDAPCQHSNEWVGTVSAGDIHSGPHSSVVTCYRCVLKSQGFVQMRTGLPATPLLTFEESRRQTAERQKNAHTNEESE